ncbi:MAG TPA: hypothetical protein VMK84_07670 [Streptosporangiaceae bacterium]|nr:hypothetical protein [Streptosporangiaceae bacterium]
MFDAGVLTAATQTIMWVVIFFFASAGASAAYLTVSETWPIEIFLGVQAAGKSLEQVTKPLTSTDQPTQDATAVAA